MKDTQWRGNSPGFSELEEESKRMSGKIKELQVHMQREKEKRLENLAEGGKGFTNLNDTLATLSATPEIDCVVMMFLRNCGMERYYENFINSQINDLSGLQDLTEKTLEEMKIPIGHRLKILKHLRTVPKNEKVFNQNFTTEHVQKSGDETFLKDKILGQSFITLTENTSSTTKSYAVSKDPTETVLSFSIQAKVPCWQCLKVHPAPDSILNYNKNFCSETCLGRFEASEKKTCACGAKFLRKQGIFYQENWICNLCAENLS